MLSLILSMTLAATVNPQMIVSTQWLADNIKHPDVRVLNIAAVADHKTAHIPGAVFLNANALTERRDNIPNELPPVAKLEDLFRNAGLKETDRIILTSDDPLLATRAWFTLDYLGWGQHAAILDGGNVKWRNEHRLMTKALTAVTPSDFKANVRKDAVIAKDELKTLLDSGEPVTLIDARNTLFFLGHKKGAEVEHAGHIPGAQCIPWQSNTIVKGGAHLLKQADQLQTIYTPFNITPENQKIVLYCRSGMEATMSYFVLRYLGFHPSLYDGSYVEWNKTERIAER